MVGVCQVSVACQGDDKHHTHNTGEHTVPAAENEENAGCNDNQQLCPYFFEVHAEWGEKGAGSHYEPHIGNIAANDVADHNIGVSLERGR